MKLTLAKTKRTVASMKHYGQACAIARALDVVGDRWSLLLVRELTLGPRRYRDLAAGPHRAAALGPAPRTRTVPRRRGPARLGTAGRRGPPGRTARRADLRAAG